MQEDVLGPLKELLTDSKLRYTACDRCGRTLLKEEARAETFRGDEPADLCAQCYGDRMRGELLPIEEEDER